MLFYGSIALILSALKNKFLKFKQTIRKGFRAFKIRLNDRKLAREQARADETEVCLNTETKLLGELNERITILRLALENRERFAPIGNESNAHSSLDHCDLFMPQENREREIDGFSFCASIRQGNDC